jgi:phospholipid-binding lipoprotein MlaA
LLPVSLHIMPRTASVPLLAILCLSLFGCATQPNTKRDPRDPLERVNRVTYRFNDAVDHAVLRPIALGYRKITPRPVRTSVSNFIDNLSYPTTIVNDLLQLKFKPFVQDTGRLVVNTTVGIGGLFDPASRIGLQKNDEDLGLTFGHWGAGPGPYLVIPLLGPSDVRDGLGRVGDIFTDPRHYIRNGWVSWGLWGMQVVDTRSRLLDSEKVLEGAYDKYAFLRNAYLQRRQYLITGGENSQQQQQQEQQQYDEEKKILEESEGGEQPESQPKDQPPPGSQSPAPPPKAKAPQSNAPGAPTSPQGEAPNPSSEPPPPSEQPH